MWISSCCPAINAYICKHRAEAAPFLAPVQTPMQAAAGLIKERDGQAVVVFIGPCIAKKGEAAAEGSQTDFALTFDELEEWLEAVQGADALSTVRGQAALSGQEASQEQVAAVQKAAQEQIAAGQEEARKQAAVSGSETAITGFFVIHANIRIHR